MDTVTLDVVEVKLEALDCSDADSDGECNARRVRVNVGEPWTMGSRLG